MPWTIQPRKVICGAIRSFGECSQGKHLPKHNKHKYAYRVIPSYSRTGYGHNYFRRQREIMVLSHTRTSLVNEVGVMVAFY